jgi:meiotically up-regulated gene 157 (Mug157) protein
MDDVGGVAFSEPGPKFKEGYATFGFNANAHLDAGNMWPVAYALTKLTRADEAKIAALVKKAVS